MNLIRYILRLHSHYPGCLFHRLTGYYCPGCGGTRSLVLLFRGDIWGSFRYHPFVLYALFAFIYVVITYIVYLVRRRTDKNIRYSFPGWTLWGAIVVIVINFVIKNGALLLFGIDLLS